MTPAALVRVGAPVERDLADNLKRLADSRERSVAAEIRLALRAWVRENTDEEAAA